MLNKMKKTSTVNKTYVQSLDHPEALSGSSVGSKALRLAELKSLGYPVPGGCVVTSEAFEAFCVHNNLWEAVQNQSYEGLAEAILLGSFPHEMGNGNPGLG